MDELKYMHLNDVEDIEIPEGLEARLAARIDRWEAMEKKEGTGRPFAGGRTIAMYARRGLSVAACIAAVIVLSMWTHRHFYGNPAHRDTFDNPEMARVEAQKALQLLAVNLSKGMAHLEQIQHINGTISNTINKTLKSIE